MAVASSAEQFKMEICLASSCLNYVSCLFQQMEFKTKSISKKRGILWKGINEFNEDNEFAAFIT